MIFLKLEDEGLSLQERRTNERGASASVKARKDKEGRRLSSVDHEKDRAVDAVFVRSDMTNEDVDDSQFVIYENRLEALGSSRMRHVLCRRHRNQSFKERA